MRLIMGENIFRIFGALFQEYDCMLLVGYNVGYAFLEDKKRGLRFEPKPLILLW